MGYDPRIQFIHEDDAVEVLYRATTRDNPGVFNVAGDGVLLLSQAIRICGKLPLPLLVPLVSPVAGAIRRFGLIDFPSDQVRFLIYGRVADNERLKRSFGYSPAYTTRAALEEFVEGNQSRRVMTPQRARGIERGVYALLAGRSR